MQADQLPREMSANQFLRLRTLMRSLAGVVTPPDRNQMIAGRLHRRLRHCRTTSFRKYLDIVEQDATERAVFVDLMTTHETFFFREPKHFERLRELAEETRGTFRLWSAACSTGEEAYSAAMTLARSRGIRPWSVVGTDISTRVLEVASRGIYPLRRLQHMPDQYLQQFCLQGSGPYEGTFQVKRYVRERVRFVTGNLSREVPFKKAFDAIFLRNVLIYFDRPNQEQIIRRLSNSLRQGGILVLGKSESARGMENTLVYEGGTCWRRR